METTWWTLLPTCLGHKGTLLYTLENVFIGNEFNHVDARFPVNG